MGCSKSNNFAAQMTTHGNTPVLEVANINFAVRLRAVDLAFHRRQRMGSAALALPLLQIEFGPLADEDFGRDSPVIRG